MLILQAFSLCVKNLPIIQDCDDLSRLEGELIVLSGLEVVDGADLPAVGLVRGEQAGGVGVKARQGGLRLLALLLKRQLDSCTQTKEADVENYVLALESASILLNICKALIQRKQ